MYLKHAHRLSSPVATRQTGVVLLVALIILVALTLAGVALIRSVDTGNLIAGNMSFHQSAVHAGERSTEQAIAVWLSAHSAAGDTNLHSNNAAQGYFAVRNERANNESWDAYWERVGSAPASSGTDTAGNTVTYVIHRLCDSTGAPHLANCARRPASVNSGGSQSAGGIAPVANNQVYYRITTRIQGPRRTVAYVQTIVAL